MLSRRLPIQTNSTACWRRNRWQRSTTDSKLATLAANSSLGHLLQTALLQRRKRFARVAITSCNSCLSRPQVKISAPQSSDVAEWLHAFYE
jgi:hypothetical protein